MYAIVHEVKLCSVLSRVGTLVFGAHTVTYNRWDTKLLHLHAILNVHVVLVNIWVFQMCNQFATSRALPFINGCMYYMDKHGTPLFVCMSIPC